MLHHLRETHSLYGKLYKDLDIRYDSSWKLPEFIDFVLEKHANQKDKYVDSGYYRHLAEVAALSTAYLQTESTDLQVISAIAWGHDLIEDQSNGKPERMFDEICNKSNESVAVGILWLTDLESGNRATRKSLARNRLSHAPGFIQTIKTCDSMSNTRTITRHDPQFAFGTYLNEIELMLNNLKDADQFSRATLERMIQEARRA